MCITQSEIENLISNYLCWLKDKTLIKHINNEWVELTTPYLDRHNDCLQLYIRKNGDRYELTDDGYIITDLANSGCLLEAPKRRELLNATLAGFGVKLERDALTINATSDNFSVKKHNLIQAALAVNDLFFLASPYVESLFLEDVTNWLDLSEIRYTPRIRFMGKSGYDHFFDFVIPKSRTQGERILQTLSNPKKDSVEATIFKWHDTKETRNENSKLYVLMNNADKVVSESTLDAFRSYQIEPVNWSDREALKPKLAA
jgi:hypothetical protein